MNIELTNDISRELLTGKESTKIQELVMDHQEGEIELFVRNGRLQKTIPPPVYLFGEDKGSKMGLATYKSIVKTVVKAIKSMDRIIEYGFIVIKYKVEDEVFLKELQLLLKDEVVHNPKRK